MRVPSLIGAIGAAVLGIGMVQAQAAPVALNRTLAPAHGPIIQVQLHCDHLRCIDLSTGAYSHSTCNRGGCCPLGGKS